MKLYKILMIFFIVLGFIGFVILTNQNLSKEYSLHSIKRSKPAGALSAFVQGVYEALESNIKNIWSLLLYPIDSIINVLKFCKKILVKFIDFIVYPCPDEVYIAWVEKKEQMLYNFFYKTPMIEKSKWLGFVITDFFIGNYVAYGILTKSLVIAKKGADCFNKIEYLNRLSALNANGKLIKLINNSNSTALINAKYSFEYADQFKQYLNDLIKCDNYNY